jgi:hypothetical protein
MCRVESLHDDYGRVDEFVDRVVRTPEGRPWNGNLVTGPSDEDDRTGRVTLVTYLFREPQAPARP